MFNVLKHISSEFRTKQSEQKIVLKAVWSFLLEKNAIDKAEKSFLISCVDDQDGIHKTLQNFIDENFEKSKDDGLVAEALTSVCFMLLVCLRIKSS